MLQKNEMSVKKVELVETTNTQLHISMASFLKEDPPDQQVSTHASGHICALFSRLHEHSRVSLYEISQRLESEFKKLSHGRALVFCHVH